MDKIIGIDVGFSGAIAIINAKDKSIIELMDMPIITTSATELNENVIKEILSDKDVKHVFIEKAQTMPQNGVVASFRYGAGYGVIRGICVGLGVPYSLCHPSTWKKKMMKDMPKEKYSSILRVCQLYPGLVMPRKKDHNKAEALLVGLYGLTCVLENSN